MNTSMGCGGMVKYELDGWGGNDGGKETWTCHCGNKVVREFDPKAPLYPEGRFYKKYS